MKDVPQSNDKLLIIFNMFISTCISVLIGTILRLYGLPCWCVCGIVAVSAVITEHILTIHPLSLGYSVRPCNSKGDD